MSSTAHTDTNAAIVGCTTSSLSLEQTADQYGNMQGSEEFVARFAIEKGVPLLAGHPYADDDRRC